MTNLQAFILAFIVLTIQTITLIVFGFKFGVQGVVATFLLFLIVDAVLCGLVGDLKIIS